MVGGGVSPVADEHEGLVARFRAIFGRDGLGDAESRLAILRRFVETEGHILAEDLFRRLQTDDVPVTLDEVRAALEGFVNYGLAVRRQFEGQPTRYEHLHRGRHHDHVICVKCGKIVEIADVRLEELKDRLARREGLRPLAHRLEVYGLCRACDREPDRVESLADLPEGERGRVVALTGGRGLKARLVSMGLNPGAVVEVVNNRGPGPFIVVSNGTRIALGYGLAQGVLVARI